MWQNLIHIKKIAMKVKYQITLFYLKIKLRSLLKWVVVYWENLCHPVVPPSENTLIYQQNQRYFPLRIHTATDVTE